MSDSAVRRTAARVVASAAWVVALSIVGKAAGLGKDIAVAARFGTSPSMDAFLVAFTIPAVIVSWFRSPIRSGFIPLFTDSIEQKGEADSWRTTGVFVGNMLVFSSLVTGVCIALAPWIVGLVAPGFDPASRALAVSLTRVMLVSIVFASFAGVLTDLLHCYGNFVVPGLANPVNNLVLMAAALYLASVYGIRALAGGVVIGSALSIAVQWRILWQHRRFFRLGVDFRQPLFRGVLRLAFPLLIGMAGAKLDDIVDRIFASRLPAGSISGLTYAMRLIDFPREILVFAFATVLFPYFSRLVSQGSSQEYADRLIDSLRIAFFVLFPISIGLALLGEPIVRLVFERGAFGEQSVRSTVPALLLYTPTLWALGLTSTMIAGFVAIKDTRTPVVAGFARLGVKIALVFAFIGAFQNAGIALATSISHVLKLVLFLFVLPAWVRAGRYGRLFRGLLGAVAASTVMAGALLLLAPLGERLGPGSTILLRLGTVGGMAGAGLVVYLAAAWVFARRELAETLRVARQGVSTILSGAARRDMPDGD